MQRLLWRTTGKETMKKITLEQIQKLEAISMRIEKASAKDPNHPIVKDIQYLTKELREAYRLIEDLTPDSSP